MLTLALAVVVVPLIFVVSASMSNPEMVYRGQVLLWPRDISFEGYARILRNPDIYTGYRNTLLYTTVGTFLNVVLTVMVAYPLSRKDLVGRNLVTIFLTITMFFTGGLIPLYLVVRGLGLVNTIGAMILPNAISFWNIIITRTYFQTTIPDDLIHAAQIDGCSNSRLLLTIIVPLSKPILAVMALYYGVGHWNAFFNALIFLSSRDLFPLQVFLREILIQNQFTQDMMQSDVMTVEAQVKIGEQVKYGLIIVSSVPILLAYPFLQRYFVKGVMVGSIKG